MSIQLFFKATSGSTKKRIPTYLRVKRGKVEVVGEHQQGYQQRIFEPNYRQTKLFPDQVQQAIETIDEKPKKKPIPLQFEITKTDTTWSFDTPYNQTIVDKMRSIGGKWRDNKWWTNPEMGEKLEKELFGLSKETINVVVTKNDLYSIGGAYLIGGYVIASRRSQTAWAKLAPHVDMIDGSMPDWGGSKRFPEINATDDAKWKLAVRRDFAEKRELQEDVEIPDTFNESGDSKPDSSVSEAVTAIEGEGAKATIEEKPGKRRKAGVEPVKTQSGKTIYHYMSAESHGSQKFTAEDHLDAAKSHREHAKTADADYHNDLANDHQEMADKLKAMQVNPEKQKAKKIESKEDVWATEDVVSSVNPYIDIQGDIDRKIVTLIMRDPKHGNMVVRTLMTIPSKEEVEKIIKEMVKEKNKEAREVIIRKRVENEINRS